MDYLPIQKEFMMSGSAIKIFDIPKFISYTDLKELIIDQSLKTMAEYKRFINKQNDASLPLDPQGVYADEWENWYKF